MLYVSISPHMPCKKSVVEEAVAGLQCSHSARLALTDGKGKVSAWPGGASEGVWNNLPLGPHPAWGGGGTSSFWTLYSTPRQGLKQEIAPQLDVGQGSNLFCSHNNWDLPV